ncbi:protein of unknown function (plasmid) [Azospirillum baldaniorum]|uniref:Uncharacterized protein n=2 Tax=Azospirillum baldaniorum TaxID=1064539 RepID=A0A9P1K0X9_9PROT|nr:protein of unknown function [Azospirillum baldaniorum]
MGRCRTAPPPRSVCWPPPKARTQGGRMRSPRPWAAGRSGPPGGLDSATTVLLGLAALPVDKRRTRLHGMGMALRAPSPPGGWNG